MKHFIEFLEPDFGRVEIVAPHGFNLLDLENGRTTYLEVRKSSWDAFSKLLSAFTLRGTNAVANYIYHNSNGEAVELNICMSRAQTDGYTYFGIYVNDYSPAVFVRRIG
ncbi:hypothetical protein ACLI1A_14905 [Flavobacterium sp. RHBU_3]|uniref:hypothetical protein n=1 Tax=Flavobacterium sp. RHBU_3 TaxID=3391184 RepID=UPI003984FEBA